MRYSYGLDNLQVPVSLCLKAVSNFEVFPLIILKDQRHLCLLIDCCAECGFETQCADNRQDWDARWCKY